MAIGRSETRHAGGGLPGGGFNLKWIWIAIALGAALLVAVALVAIDRLRGSGSENADSTTPASSQSAAAQTPAATAPIRTETITYDSWTVNCRISGEQPPKRTCSGVLQLTEQANRRVLLAWIIARDNQGTLQTVMQTPTGVKILEGVTLKFANASSRKLAYTICDPQHCEAATVVDGSLLKDLLSSTEVTVTIQATDGRGLNFNLPIKGIDKVIGSMSNS